MLAGVAYGYCPAQLPRVCPCVQGIKNEIERVNLEIAAAERDYDLNRAAELKYGTLLALQKQLRDAEGALLQQV